MIAIMILGSILRLLYLLHPKSLWFDEWASVSFSSASFWQTVVSNIQDTHPPLYFLLLHACIQIFGYDEWVFRLPSFIGGIAALVAIYGTAQAFFNKKTALWTVFFFAISPFFIHLSQEIRNHGLPVLFCLMGTWAFLRLDSPKPLLWRIAFVASSAAAIYTEHFAWFWLFSIFVWAFLSKKFDRSLWQLFVLVIPGLFLFTYHAVNGQEVMAYENLGPNYTVFTALKQVVIVYWHFLTGYQFLLYWTSHVISYLKDPIFWLNAVVFVWAGLYILRGIYNASRKNRFAGIFFALVIFGPVLAVAAVNPTRVETRYFSFAAPFAVMAIASGMQTCMFPRLARFFPAVWASALMIANVHMIRLPVDALHREDYLSMTRFVSSQAGPQDAIVANGNTIFRYYSQRLSLPVTGQFFLELENIDAAAAARFERIFYLDGLPVEGNDFPILKGRMEKIGFEADGAEKRFGGALDYAIVNVFRKKAPAIPS